MRSRLLAFAALAALGCASSQPQQPTVTAANGGATAVTTSVRVRVHVNCEAICRNIETACRRGCRPTSYSPQNREIEDACEHDCDFNRFSCESECERG